MPDLLNIIKTAALEAIGESSPTKILIGTVIKVNPLTIKITPKLIIDEGFILIPDRLKKEGIIVKDKLVFIRNLGGQQYIALDKIGGNLNDSGDG